MRWSASQLLQHTWLLEAQHSRTDLADLVNPLAPSPSEPDDYLQLSEGASPWGTLTPSPSIGNPSSNPSPAYSSTHSHTAHAQPGLSDPWAPGTDSNLADDVACWPLESISAGIVDQYSEPPLLMLPPRRMGRKVTAQPSPEPHPESRSAGMVHQYSEPPQLMLPPHRMGSRAAAQPSPEPDPRASSAPRHQHGTSKSDINARIDRNRHGACSTLVLPRPQSSRQPGMGGGPGSGKTSSGSSSGGDTSRSDLMSTGAGGHKPDGSKPGGIKAGSLLSSPPFARSKAALQQSRQNGLQGQSPPRPMSSSGLHQQPSDAQLVPSGDLLESTLSGRHVAALQRPPNHPDGVQNGSLPHGTDRTDHHTDNLNQPEVARSAMERPSYKQHASPASKRSDPGHQHEPGSLRRLSSQMAGNLLNSKPSPQDLKLCTLERANSKTAGQRLTSPPSKIMAKRSMSTALAEEDVCLQRQVSELGSRREIMQQESLSRQGSGISSSSSARHEHGHHARQAELSRTSSRQPQNGEDAAHELQLTDAMGCMDVQDGPLARGLSGQDVGAVVKPAKRSLFGFRR